MNNFNIRYKLIISFLALLLLLLPITFYNLFRLNSLQDNLSQIVGFSGPRIQALFQMQVTALNMRILINDFNVTSNKNLAQIDSEKNALLAYLSEIDTQQQKYLVHVTRQQQNILDTRELEKLKDNVMQSALDFFNVRQKNISPLIQDLKEAQLNQAQIELNRFIKNAVNNEFLMLNITQINAAQLNQALYQFSIIASVMLVILAIAASFLLAYYISKPIIQLKNFASSISADSLHKRVAIVSKDEIGDLAKSLNNMLEKLSQSETQLIDASREAGKAEIAITILHNVGNILTSINVSIALIKENFNKQQMKSFLRAIELLKVNVGNLSDYLINDDKGKILLPYITKSVQHIESDQKVMQAELDSILTNIDQVNSIIAMQHSFTKVSDIQQPVSISNLVNSALAINSTVIKESGIKIKRDYGKDLNVVSVKPKLEQILAVLIKNSIDALEEQQGDAKNLIIKTETPSNDAIRITVQDNGIGISKENLPKIFSFGFSTKKNSRGYALHNAFLLAKELNGQISVQSAGLGKGSSFSLDIPQKKTKKSSL